MQHNNTLWNTIVRRGSHAELADYLIAQWGGPTKSVWDGAFYIYDNAAHTWKLRSNDACIRDIKAFDGLEFGPTRQEGNKPPTRKQITVSDSLCKSVLNLARAEISARTGDDTSGFFNNAPFGVMCDDVFLCATGAHIDVRPCTSDDRQRVKLCIPYAHDAHAPMWVKALEDWFGSDEDGMRKRALLAEFVGAALFGLSTRYQKALFLLGGGGNGKSQLLDVVGELFPHAFLSAIQPQKWSDPYSRDQLRGSRLNLVHEIPTKAIAGGTDFKAIITGDPITAREIYKSPYTYRPRTAHVFSANELPGSTDITEGFWRRVVVLTMPKRFDGTQQMIPELAKKIIAVEMPGVLAWAVAGAQRLLTQDTYTVPESSIEAVQDWKDSCDPLGQWINERTTPAQHSHERTKSSTLFQDWKNWSGGELQPKSNRGFSLEMKKRSHNATRRTAGVSFDLKIK